MGTTIGRLLLVALLTATAAGCARPQAKTQPEMPMLEPPPPPPRLVVVEPLEEEVRPEPPAPSPPLQRPRQQQPRAEPLRQDAPKPDPPKAEVKPTEIDEAPRLEILPAGNEDQSEPRIRQLIANATRDLNRIDYRQLNPDRRTQYDTAKRFMEQAEEALARRNLVFAFRLADKAAEMAHLLLSR
jgi:hypothetical protein